MRRYLDFLWTNRATLTLLALLLLVAGWLALGALPRSVFPDVDFPRVTVLVSDANLPVRYMLLQVTEPLEQAAKGVAGVRLVKSQSGVGLSKLHVYFGDHVAPETAYLTLQARLAQIPLPPGARMTVRLMTPHIQPFAQYALVSDRVDSSAMMPFYAFDVRPALLSVRGVYQVNGTGRGWPVVTLSLSPRRLAEHHLSAGQVVAALRQAQGPFFAGLLDRFHQQFVLVSEPRPKDPAALGRLMLPLGPRGPDGARAALPLDALGHVSTGPPPLIIGAAVSGYRHALLIDVSAQAGANVVQVAGQVHAQVQSLRAELPPGVHLIRIYDFSSLVRHSLGDVWIALLLGTAIAWAVVLLFLRRLDSALATLLVVPLAMAGTFLVLHVLGFGINIMTLGGLTAAIGALVDHAIVVMERGLRGLPAGAAPALRRRTALAACGEILPLMTLATLTSSVVFLPLIFLSGTLGLLFRHMALAIVIALLVSQVVALALTPVLAAWLAHRPARPPKPWRWARRLRLGYDRALRAGTRRPWLALPVAALLIAAGLLAGLGLPTAFLPRWDEGAIAVPFRTPVGTPTDETLAAGRRLAAVAAHDAAVARVSVVVGRSLENSRATSNKGDLVIILRRDRRATTEAMMQTLRRQFHAAQPDLIELKLHQIMSNRLENLSGSHSPLSILLFGKDPAELHRYGKRLQAEVRASGRFENTVFKSPSAGPEIVLRPRDRARLLGVDGREIAAQVRADEWGRRAGFLLRGEQILPLRVRVDSPGESPQTLARLPLRLPDGTQTPLGQLAHVRLHGSVPYVTHDNLVPYAYLWMAPKPGEGLAAAAGVLHHIIAGAHLPPGIVAVVGGYYRQQAQGFRQMSLILGGALLVLLILFGFQFSGQRPAVAALAAIALAAPGAFLALRLTGTALDSTAFLGLLLVSSIAVNNVILIFSLARSRAGRLPDAAAVARSARLRLRPILMTMLADVLGFLPIAIGVGRGTDLLKPLAIAVMGGLSLAVFASLWLAPVFYAGLLRLRPARTD
ncbi:efflux RND transporter permease subunit [Acidihalobacter prosperus]|uniref:Transporter n=1 Tax=Acidihalobacter prosperus TaxID=160660 RepID=A0A1A6C3Q5_9GAMM|nr:efflux RND transporter permease subunit [Acidihalobacter prosperus]OBS09191.1 transporter [Acidihalobacter prosperus]